MICLSVGHGRWVCLTWRWTVWPRSCLVPWWWSRWSWWDCSTLPAVGTSRSFASCCSSLRSCPLGANLTPSSHNVTCISCVFTRRQGVKKLFLCVFVLVQFTCQSGHGKDGFQLDDQERLQNSRDDGEGEHHTWRTWTHILPPDGQNRLAHRESSDKADYLLFIWHL